MRKIWNWFRDLWDKIDERYRDKTRDELADALYALGIGATMAERGRHEEKLKRQGDSLGLIDIAQGPVKWINVVCHVQRSGAAGSTSTTYWYVFGIPSEGELPSGPGGKFYANLGLPPRPVELSSVSRRGGLGRGSIERVEWRGYDGGSGLPGALTAAPEVEAFCKRQGDLYIRSHDGAFQGWTVEMEKKPLYYLDWAQLETIARILLSSG